MSINDNFPYAGYVSGGSLKGVGSSLARAPEVGPVDAGGYYWSRTVDSINSSQYAYDLWFNISYVIPANTDYRYYGFSVRCVATT